MRFSRFAGYEQNLNLTPILPLDFSENTGQGRELAYLKSDDLVPTTRSGKPCRGDADLQRGRQYRGRA